MIAFSRWAAQHKLLVMRLSVIVFILVMLVGWHLGMVMEAYDYSLPNFFPVAVALVFLLALGMRFSRVHWNGEKKSFKWRYWERRGQFFVLNLCVAALSITVGNFALQEDKMALRDLIYGETISSESSVEPIKMGVGYGREPIEKTKKKDRKKKKKRSWKSKKKEQLRGIYGEDGKAAFVAWGVFLVILSVLLTGGLCGAICTLQPAFITLAVFSLVASIWGWALLLNMPRRGALKKGRGGVLIHLGGIFAILGMICIPIFVLTFNASWNWGLYAAGLIAACLLLAGLIMMIVGAFRYRRN